MRSLCCGASRSLWGTSLAGSLFGFQDAAAAVIGQMPHSPGAGYFLHRHSITGARVLCTTTVRCVMTFAGKKLRRVGPRSAPVSTYPRSIHSKTGSTFTWKVPEAIITARGTEERQKSSRPVAMRLLCLIVQWFSAMVKTDMSLAELVEEHSGMRRELGSCQSPQRLSIGVDVKTLPVRVGTPQKLPQLGRLQ